MGTLNVVVVCGFGLGSSEILVVNVQRVLESLGIKDYNVQASSLALSSTFEAEIIITSGIFVQDIKERLRGKEVPIIPVRSFVNINEITNKLKKTLEEMGRLK